MSGEMAGSVVCIGESMAQIVPDDGAGLEHASSFAITTAGAESNVAIALARLGTRASWAGFLGDDPLGRRIRDDLAAAGVATPLVREVGGHRTGTFFKDPNPAGSTVYYYRSGSAATLMDVGYARSVLDTAPRAVHVTGVTLALSESCWESVTTLAREARASGVPVSFDVNYRAPLWPDRRTAANAIEAVARRSDIVFVGLDEAHALWNCATADDVREILPEPRRLVVKDGAIECVVFSEEGRIAVPALPVEVVEPVGAGDAFAAGWLHGYLSGLDDPACVRLGHLMAGVALTSHSDVGRLDVPADELVRRAAEGTDWIPAGTPAVGAATAQAGGSHAAL
ncbi:sugar kinase [Agromyces sp. SYSU T0242]|uniref:sugar kinase n=1 Tax=Agromyces litoreus TaxID=3158561 RepID=UPI003393D240